MRPETASRLKHQVMIQSLPPPTVLSAIFRTAKLSKALAQVDKYLYATAVHCRLAVVTGDRRLGQAVQKAQLPVADMAIVLCHLVLNQHITPSQCDSLLKALVGQCEFLLGHQARL